MRKITQKIERMVLMMAMLWAQEIMSAETVEEAKALYERCPRLLKAKVKDIARDLILLYSKRKQETGFAYTPDSFMQHELEASFIYEDTPDQMKATAEVKADMEYRDKNDSGRNFAPLRAADDSITLDNTDITAQEAADKICRLAKERRGEL